MKLPFASVLVSLHLVAAHAQAPASWHLVLDHEIRPPESSPHSLGKVLGASLLPDGSLFVAEQKPVRISLFDQHGTFVRQLMRDGSGPGEALEPEITARGDTLIVADPGLSRLTRMLSSGRVVDERTVTARPTGKVWVANDGRIVVQSYSWGSFTDAVEVFHPGGTIDSMAWAHPEAEDIAFVWRGPNWMATGRIPFAPRGVYTFDPAGHLVVGGSRHSQWFVVDRRDTIQTVTLPDHPVAIGTSIRDSAWASYYSKLDTTRMPHMADVVVKDRLPKTLPPWTWFDIDAAGNWWVGRPDPRAQTALWDIVSAGRIVARVTAPAAMSEHWPGPVLGFNKSEVAILREDGDGLPSIDVYRIVRQ